MKVRELVDKMHGIHSYGIYGRDECVAESHVNMQQMMKYLDEEVFYFNVWIYDDKDYDIEGHQIDVKRIRCCIYCNNYFN